ncbi:MAG: type II toxin-antitoxin system mRNA interferase toxin, RelE/StbE family [Nanoarchaeota archaeon]|nr:type II toxin-antitoxin system mRNA interferase toxin, RelE/StbE family [Nanoarchaeota archaeon]
MYRIFTSNKRVERKLKNYIESRKDIFEKLKRLSDNLRKECGAHPLKGKLKGKWSCWLGSNIRIIYIIDDINEKIWIESVGSHKIY